MKSDTPASATKTSLYEQLQKNKHEKETEFYEETKSESLRGLTEEDAKFLATLQESQEARERELKAANEAELQAFKQRHEQLAREAVKRAEEEARAEALKTALKAKSSIIKTAPNATVTKLTASSKRAKLGITPIKPH